MTVISTWGMNMQTASEKCLSVWKSKVEILQENSQWNMWPSGYSETHRAIINH